MPDVFTFMPLYPILVGILYKVIGVSNLAAIAIFQAFLDGFTTLLIFGLTRRRYGSAAAFLAGIGFALLGIAATYSLVTMTVSLGLFWIMLTATLSDLWKDRWTLTRAMVFGLVLGTGGQIIGAFWLMILPFGILVALAKPKTALVTTIYERSTGYPGRNSMRYSIAVA